MSRRTSGNEEKYSQKMPAGTSTVKPGGVHFDRATVLLDIQKKTKDNEELGAKIEERKKLLESLQAQVEESRKKFKRVTQFQLDFKALHKEEDGHRGAERAERVKREALRMEEEEKRLKDEYAKLLERKVELQCEVETHAVYHTYMEQAVKMTKFEDVSQLTNHLESLLHFKEQLCQKDAESEQQVDEMKKALATMKDQHHLEQLQRNSQLSQLQTELARTLSEAVTWERKWNHILETAAKKTIRLTQIKMAALNIFEMIGGNEEEMEAVDINDTEQQLDKVTEFFLDHVEFLKHHQSAAQRQKDGKGKKQVKKPDAAHLKIN